MKILYITKKDYIDYQNDCLLIGLRELFGEDLVDVHKREFLYSSYNDEKRLRSYWGKGFTVSRVLDDIEIDRHDIEKKIIKKYFDYIIYGSIHRCYNYFELVIKHYKKNQIIAVDGEDIRRPLSPIKDYGIVYFRRELNFNHPKIFPISFAFPTTKILFNELKSKDKAFIDPRDKSTYIYNNEKDYYKDYQDSRFAITMKKRGWDCMRHYEILANGCLPIFLDIEKCPTNTMTSFPKNLCSEINSKIKQISMSDIYNDYVHKFKIHFLLNNTTKAEAKKFIDTIKILSL